MKKIKTVKLLVAFSFFAFIACYNSETSKAAFDLLKDSDTLTVADCLRCIVLTDQSVPSVDIVDIKRDDRIIWHWTAKKSNISFDKIKWFNAVDDAKPVYDLKYLLINASGGGVALIRIADKKAVFYAYAGKNPHSSELLPDGNIVTASSTDSRLIIFHVDTTAASNKMYKDTVSLPFAHNVVWDKKRQVLWSAGDNYLYKLEYNFNKTQPKLTKVDSFALPGKDAHDLFPVYGKDSLWLTNTNGVYVIDMKTIEVTSVDFKYYQHIKSVSSGPDNWPTIIMKPKTKWWSDQVIDKEGNNVYTREGMKIYKARWFLPNPFSYELK